MSSHRQGSVGSTCAAIRYRSPGLNCALKKAFATHRTLRISVELEDNPLPQGMLDRSSIRTSSGSRSPIWRSSRFKAARVLGGRFADIVTGSPVAAPLRSTASENHRREGSPPTKKADASGNTPCISSPILEYILAEYSMDWHCKHSCFAVMPKS